MANEDVIPEECMGIPSMSISLADIGRSFMTYTRV